MIDDGPMQLGTNDNVLIPFSPYQIRTNKSEDQNEFTIVGGQLANDEKN